MKKILCVDDELAILDMLASYLRAKKYIVLKAINARTALKLVKAEKPDLMLLDWMLPDINGPDLVRKIRKSKNRNMPIIMLTAKGEVEDKISALNIGADDYLVKPFSLQELNARIKALLRRTDKAKPVIYKYANLKLNPESRKAKVSSVKLKLNRIEFNLLEHFLKHPEKIYSRAQLLDTIWENEPDISERTVDVHISRLRKKLKPHALGELIKSVRGIGYILSADENIQDYD